MSDSVPYILWMRNFKAESKRHVRVRSKYMCMPIYFVSNDTKIIQKISKERQKRFERNYVNRQTTES